MTYNSFNAQVISGNYDNTTGALTITDDHGYNFVGQVNLVNKRVSGTILVNNAATTLYYQGSNKR